MQTLLTAVCLLSLLAAAEAKGCANDDECLKLNDPTAWRCRNSSLPGSTPCALDCCFNTTGMCSCVDEPCIPLAAPPKTSKKQYLIIGDSVSMGYHKVLASTLEAQGWDVFHAPGNNDNTNWGRKCLSGWLTSDPTRWDAISLNFGLRAPLMPPAPPRAPVAGVPYAQTPEDLSPARCLGQTTWRSRIMST